MRPGSSEGLLLCVLPHPPPPVLTLPGGGGRGGRLPGHFGHRAQQAEMGRPGVGGIPAPALNSCVTAGKQGATLTPSFFLSPAGL